MSSKNLKIKYYAIYLKLWYTILNIIDCVYIMLDKINGTIKKR